MQVIVPIAVTDAVLTASNVPENDYPAWSSATTYAVGDRVIVLSKHDVYEALAGNTNSWPPDNPSNWVKVGATNRWKAFDRKISDQVQQATSITYTLTVPTVSDGLAFFNLSGSTVRVEAVSPTGTVLLDQTIALADTSTIVDWFSFFMWEAPILPDIVLFSVPAYKDYQIRITISGATAKVGQIVAGRIVHLGTAQAGTTIGITDYSRKERDDFGNPIIIERAFSDRVTFQFAFPGADAARVKRVIAGLRATPAVYTLGPGTEHLGTTIYGFLSGDLEIPLVSAGHAFASLEIEGLI